MFMAQMEMELYECVIKSRKMFHGLKVFGRIAFHFAEVNQINHSFNKDQKLLEEDCLTYFIFRTHSFDHSLSNRGFDSEPRELPE